MNYAGRRRGGLREIRLLHSNYFTVSDSTL